MMKKLRYGNTNTFYIEGINGGLLIDTDMAGTLPLFFRAIKAAGIEGEILSTPSHSEDSVSLILDDGACMVGDLEPMEYLAGYGENPALEQDWERIISRHPSRILYAHGNEKTI